MNSFFAELRIVHCIRSIACAGSMISSATLWLVVTATAIFVWALSSVLQDTSAHDIQGQQASILFFMTWLTMICTIVVGNESVAIWRQRVHLQRHHKLHLHIRLFYSVFAIGLSVMELYWMIFKIIFQDCSDVFHVNYRLQSGNVLFVGQLAHAAVNIPFPLILATWLTLHHRYKAPKPATASYSLILLTLLVKTLFVYLDEAQLMIGDVTHHGCSNTTSNPRHALNCTSIATLDYFELYKTLYKYHMEVLEPLEYAISCEGLTIFLAVVFLFKKMFYDNSDDHEATPHIEWANLWNMITKTNKLNRIILPCAVIVGFCLSIGVFVLFIQLFGDTGYFSGRDIWENYLIVRCSMFAVVTSLTMCACIKSSKNRSQQYHRILPSEQFDIKLLFYSMVLGPIPFFLCTLYASVVPWDKDHECYLESHMDISQFLDSIFNFFQVTSQYIFMTSTIEFKSFEKRSPNQTFDFEVATILLLASCQLVMWIINTGSKHIIAKINITGRDYYPASFWALAMALMYPSGVFFRAHGLSLCGTLLYHYLRSICSSYEELEDNTIHSDIVPVPQQPPPAMIA